MEMPDLEDEGLENFRDLVWFWSLNWLRKGFKKP